MMDVTEYKDSPICYRDVPKYEIHNKDVVKISETYVDGYNYLWFIKAP